MKKKQKNKIAIIGLGYVGLPLATSLSKHIEVIGFDKDKTRIDQLKKGIDLTKEVSKNDLIKNSNVKYSSNPDSIKSCNIYIITVPTPINADNEPDLSSLIDATKLVAKFITNNNIVVYESTVYPGTTEEICVPILSPGFILSGL